MWVKKKKMLSCFCMVKICRAKALVRLTLLDECGSWRWFMAGGPHCVSAATKAGTEPLLSAPVCLEKWDIYLHSRGQESRALPVSSQGEFRYPWQVRVPSLKKGSGRGSMYIQPQVHMLENPLQRFHKFPVCGDVVLTGEEGLAWDERQS